MGSTKINKEKFTYELSVPFQYALKNGETCDAQFIELCPPSSRNMAEISDLKQAFFRALPKDDKGNSGDDGGGKDALDNLDADTVMVIISMAHGVDLKSVLISAKELFCSGLAFADGETKMTKPMIDSMDQDDLESMLGHYYVNFILASWLIKMKAIL